jgi:hypothetical protein
LKSKFAQAAGSCPFDEGFWVRHWAAGAEAKDQPLPGGALVPAHRGAFDLCSKVAQIISGCFDVQFTR